MIQFKTVVKRAGGTEKLARALGYPVNKFTLSIWQRNGYVPEQFREQVAALIEADPEDLIPDTDGASRALLYRAAAVAYRSLAAGCGANTRTLAKLHDVTPERVDLWRSGYEEPPVEAFIDLYNVVTGRAMRSRGIQFETLMKQTGLTQGQLCRKLGVTSAMGTYWKKTGRVPPKWAEAVARLPKADRPGK